MVDRDKIRSEMVQRLRRANVSLDLFDRNAIADMLESLQEGIDSAVPLILEGSRLLRLAQARLEELEGKDET